MHPAMIHWWKQRHAHGCGPSASPGEWEASGGGGGGGGGPDLDGGAGFGVRRPLRFLAYKLELDEAQVEKLARILDELKIERAQAAVDHRRSSAAFADAITGDSLDPAALAAAASERAKTAERLGSAVTKALTKIHELLTPKQRGQLAYLIRTGTLAI
jgi:Spy/CpxP family protein refolding chaperone